MAKKQHNTQIISEIADYILAHPDKKMSAVMSVYVSKYGKNERTVWRWINVAKEYNEHRLAAQEEAKNAEIQKSVEHIRECIMSRGEALRRLKDIAVNAQTESNSVRAVDLIAKIEGYYAPTRHDVTSGGAALVEEKPLSKEEAERINQELDAL